MNDESIIGRILLIIVLVIAGFFFWPLFGPAAFLAYALTRDVSKLEPERLPNTDPRRIVKPTDPHWRNAFTNVCESPAETAFLTAMIERHGLLPSTGMLQNDSLQLDMQVPIGRYRTDFVINARLVVEIDGAAYHGSPEAKARDAERDRWMRSEGYHVLRIAAKTALSTPGNAIAQVDIAIRDHDVRKPTKTEPPNHGPLVGHAAALIKDTGRTLGAIADGAAYVNRFAAIKLKTQEVVAPLEDAIHRERMIVGAALKYAEAQAEIDRFSRDPENKRRYDKSRQRVVEAINRASGGTYVENGPCTVSFLDVPSIDDIRLEHHNDAEIDASVSREEASILSSHTDFIRSSLSTLIRRPDEETHFWKKISWFGAPNVEQRLHRIRSQMNGQKPTPLRQSPFSQDIMDDDIPF